MSTRQISPDFPERLLKFVIAEVSLINDTIETDTDLLLTGAVDSLGVMSITGWIEDELGFEVDATEITLDNFLTVERTLRYCESKLA